MAHRFHQYQNMHMLPQKRRVGRLLSFSFYAIYQIVMLMLSKRMIIDAARGSNIGGTCKKEGAGYGRPTVVG